MGFFGFFLIILAFAFLNDLIQCRHYGIFTVKGFSFQDLTVTECL